ncbi:MAG TPA: substrate-binding domain-containing protein, partial [Puia sp.]|nr:substrate-binding domain-containing protein [Puia sp.]
YREALNEYQIEANDQLIFDGNVSIESGKDAIRHFSSLGTMPDAVFAVEDFTALGAVQELKQLNIRIPEEVGVIGFANEHFGEYITPGLSTIDQQTVLMGKESVQLLMKLMGSSELIHARPEKIVLEPVPVFRKSSMRRP